MLSNMSWPLMSSRSILHSQPSLYVVTPPYNSESLLPASSCSSSVAVPPSFRPCISHTSLQPSQEWLPFCCLPAQDSACKITTELVKRNSKQIGKCSKQPVVSA